VDLLLGSSWEIDTASALNYGPFQNVAVSVPRYLGHHQQGVQYLPELMFNPTGIRTCVGWGVFPVLHERTVAAIRSHRLSETTSNAVDFYRINMRFIALSFLKKHPPWAAISAESGHHHLNKQAERAALRAGRCQTKFRSLRIDIRINRARRSEIGIASVLLAATDFCQTKAVVRPSRMPIAGKSQLVGTD